MITYFDTNVLIHSVIDQDRLRRHTSQKLLDLAIVKNEIILSPLSIIEFVYVLSRLKLEDDFIRDRSQFFSRFVSNSIDTEILKNALSACGSGAKYKNINDAIHLFFAESYADILYTYDSDFKSLTPLAKIKVKILN